MEEQRILLVDDEALALEGLKEGRTRGRRRLAEKALLAAPRRYVGGVGQGHHSAKLPATPQ